MNARRKVTVLAAIGSIFAGSLVTPAVAQALTVPAACNNASKADACFYYNGNISGAVYYSRGVVETDMAGDKYGSSGAGAGQYVKNNAASFANPTGYTDYVFYNENCSGPQDTIAAHTAKNLVNTFNENASWVSAAFGIGNC